MFQYKKAIQALNLFASKTGGHIDLKKAYTLMWLSDRLHLRRHGRTIISDEYLASIDSLVPGNTKMLIEDDASFDNKTKEYRDQYIAVGTVVKSMSRVDRTIFSETDDECLDVIYYTFKDITDTLELKDYPEWRKWEHTMLITGKSFWVDYMDFFRDTDNTHGIFLNDIHMIEITMEMYRETIGY
jgi:hypothetical protein